MPSRIDFKKELNTEQFAVACRPDGHCLVLAGAGSGKTRTIVYRVAWLLEQGVQPEQILLLTFTNKAANEMMHRINELTATAGPSKIWGGTFHSIANRILRSFANRIGYRPDFSILDQEDSRALVKACMRELGHDAKDKRFPSAAVLQSIISYGRNAMLGVERTVAKQHPNFIPLVEDIKQIADRYGNKKRLANAMDFDDLLTNFLLLLEQDVSARERLTSQFKHILVDEFQDTNAVQAAIVRRLAGDGVNVIAVGDDAQSIYSFRAAEVRNILDFTKHYPGAAVSRLETNYRSTPDILDLANDIISRNTDQFEKNLTTPKQRYIKPEIVPMPSARAEADFIVEKVEALIAEGVAEKEIAVLFRAAYQSQALEFALMRRDIAYDYRGGMKFFERAHIKDTLSFLRIKQNWTDEAAWLRILPLHTGIGDVATVKLFTELRNLGSMAHALLAPLEQMFGARIARGWKELRDELESLQSAGEKPGDLVRAVLDSGYVSYLEAEYTDFRDRKDDLEQLANFADNYEKLSEFLADITLDDSVTQKKTSHAPKIVLSTIHQAKGLEWDSVFVIHLTASGFPNRRAALEQGGLEEERRLFYVAVTRAKRHLYLSYPMMAGHDGFTMELPSMFLEEIDPSLVIGSQERSRHDQGDDDGREASTWARRAVSSDATDAFFKEEAVEVDAMGEMKERMKAVKKGFLREV